MRSRGSLTASLLAALAVGPAAAAQDVRPGIAVLPFENGGSIGRGVEDYESLRRGIAGLLIGELGQNPRVRLVERAETQRLLDEQSLGAAGRVNSATAARVGQLVGARYMIAGTFIDLYGEFRLYARVIDVETGEILASPQADPKLKEIKDLYRQVQSLAQTISDEVKLPTLPPTTVVAARDVPTEATLLYSRAVLYEDQGQKLRAIEFYERALAVFPEFTLAQEALRKLRGT